MGFQKKISQHNYISSHKLLFIVFYYVCACAHYRIIAREFIYLATNGQCYLSSCTRVTVTRKVSRVKSFMVRVKVKNGWENFRSKSNNAWD